MKKALASAVMFLTNSVFAYYADPHQQFEITPCQVNQSKITVIQAPGGMTQTCAKESTPLTGKTTNFYTLGHEVKHCLQGHWHP